MPVACASDVRTTATVSIRPEDLKAVDLVVNCIANGPFLNHCGVFRSRIGFSRADVRHILMQVRSGLYDMQRIEKGSALWFIINNCFNEVVTMNTCGEWVRWFGTVSRRKVQEVYDRLGFDGMLQKYNGKVVQLHIPKNY